MDANSVEGKMEEFVKQVLISSVGAGTGFLASCAYLRHAFRKNDKRIAAMGEVAQDDR